MDSPQISFILHRDSTGEFRLWACRGDGKGCSRNRFRNMKAPCPDCFWPVDESKTIGEVYELINKGDA